MTERINPSFENMPDYENLPKAEKSPGWEKEKTKEKDEKPLESIESIKEKVERHSKEAEELRREKLPEKDQEEPVAPEPIGADLRQSGKKQTLRAIRRSLPAYSRPFSKVIHQPVVEAISEVSGKTVARPSALFSGALFSVISSLAILFISRYYGYEYNFLVGIVSFAGGFAAGLLIEMLARLFHKH